MVRRFTEEKFLEGGVESFWAWKMKRFGLRRRRQRRGESKGGLKLKSYFIQRVREGVRTLRADGSAGRALYTLGVDSYMGVL